ncbi:hypothetical protein BJY24_007161 [Nocardia transvalensis]|uniref:Uncharacterized protein n=1 Tax=Nocardia transvalensis TaxID=37333 RepID=A0A7W9PL85_9NOCA|nr:hypothetical protein [Nocardia transvalensis]MBB5918249.1 hypothetical protein [Nocardia transvalensis]
MVDARELLTYEVTISRPDDYRDSWWRVGNAGTPEQTAAALSELATRCALELAEPTGRCWYVCDIRFADDVQVDYFVGSIRAEHLADQLRYTAARTLTAVPSTS